MSKLNLALPLQEYQQPEPKRRFRLIQGGLCRHKPESDDLRGERVVVDRSLEFKRWLALFFIEQGKYKITEKGYAELAPKVVRMDTHFGEDFAAKERSTKSEIARPLTRSEIKEAVARKVGEMFREGKAEELYNKGLIDRPFNFDWQNRETRITVIKKLLEFLGASPRRLDELREELDELIMQSLKEDKTDTKRMQKILDGIRGNLEKIRTITADDFKTNGLTTVLRHYKNSPYLALVEVGYVYSEKEFLEHAKTGEFKTDKIYPWEMPSAPQGFYKKSENRIAATKWLVWKINKEPRDMTYDDFYKSGLSGLLANYYQNSPYIALLDIGCAYSIEETLEHAKVMHFETDKIYPWEMKKAPSMYDDTNFRIAATKWLIWKLKKESREITQDDFYNNGLSGLLNHYKDSPYLALVEAGYAYPFAEVKKHSRNGAFRTDKIYPWEMNKVKIWDEKEIRIAATKWLMWKLNKKPREITQGDFNNNGLGGLLGRPEYKRSPYKALSEADLVTSADKAYMRRFSGARFS